MTTPETSTPAPQETPAGTGKGRFHVLRNVLVNGLTLVGAGLFFYFTLSRWRKTITRCGDGWCSSWAWAH